MVRRYPQVAEHEGGAPHVAQLSLQAQTLLEECRRLSRITPVTRHGAQVDEHHRCARLVAELPPQDQALLQPRPRLVIVGLVACQHTSPVERLGPRGGRRRAFLKGLFEPPAPFAQVAALVPEPPQVRNQPQGHLRVPAFE